MRKSRVSHMTGPARTVTCFDVCTSKICFHAFSCSLAHLPIQTSSTQKEPGHGDKSSSTSTSFTSMKSENETGCDLPAAAAISLHAGVFCFSRCLETKASWLHVKAAAAHKKRITSARTCVLWVQHLPRRCLERKVSPSEEKNASPETSKKLKTRSSLMWAKCQLPALSTFSQGPRP